MFGASTALAGAGMLARRLIVRENSTEPVFWLLQRVMWLAALLPIMVLLARFQALQTKIMIEERAARREVEAALAERHRLEDEVTRISEDDVTNGNPFTQIDTSTGIPVVSGSVTNYNPKGYCSHPQPGREWERDSFRRAAQKARR
jgi:hypothetical protein